LDETVDDATATVSSALLARTGREVDIDYRMVRRGEAWLVRDVLVDGVSLAANYRVQFERVLQQGSYAELVARMEEKVAGAARATASVRGADGAPPAVVVAAIRDEPGAVVTDVRASSVPQPPMPSPSGTRVEATRPAPPPTPPTVPATTASPTTLRPTAAREVWVQVGVFRTVDAAARMMQQLRRYAVMLTFGGERPAPRARLLVGPFADRAAAVSTIRALHASGLAAFITDTPD